MRVHREGQEKLLDATESGGRDGGYDWLKIRRLDFVPVYDGLAGAGIDDESLFGQKHERTVSGRLLAAVGDTRRNEAVMDQIDRMDAKYGRLPQRSGTRWSPVRSGGVATTAGSRWSRVVRSRRTSRC